MRVTACLLVLLTLSASLESTDFIFNRYYADQNYGGNGRPGFVRSGDMDGDGDPDIVGGGGYALFVYENDGAPARPDWTRFGNLDGTGGIGLNGASLYDVDGDRDLDVVGAMYTSDLGWWENPGTLGNDNWNFHTIGSTTSYLHCMIRTDLDGDHIAEEFVANLTSGSNLMILWFRPGPDPTQPWESHIIESGRNHGNNNHAGLDAGDVDGDSHLDIAYSNGWYEAPDDPAGVWTWRQVTGISGISNVALSDLDGDGDLDLITASGHSSTGVFWFECPANPGSESWTQHAIDASVANPEGLAVADLDYDGDSDVIACDLDFNSWDQEVHHVYVYENTGTVISPTWNKQDISGGSYASHKLQISDINDDGLIDIISEGCGYQIISYYENATPGIVCNEPADEVGNLRLTHDMGGTIVLSWDSTIDPCSTGYRVFSATTASPSAPPGSFPDDPPFVDITIEDLDADRANEVYLHDSAALLLFYLVVDDRFDGSLGLAGHYGG
ncbi:FG-GAP-like repeat-containing protein [Acidobacteriota bacterium]